MKNRIILRLSIAIAFFLTGYTISSVSTHPNTIEKLVYRDRLILLDEVPFSDSLLVEKLKEVKVKFPYIVYAQALHETNRFTSGIFLENNNLFGMKMAWNRPTTAIGENRGHAVYACWEDSVLDYAFYQTSYLRSLKTEAEYLQYLNQHYAEDPNYQKITEYFAETKVFFKKRT